MASLFVIEGADQGKRFDLRTVVNTLGRDVSNPIRLQDGEISRKHAEIRALPDRSGFELLDLNSANGTYVNEKLVQQCRLQTGDQVRLGNTLLLFSEGTVPAHRASAERVMMLGKASPADRSEIVQTMTADQHGGQFGPMRPGVDPVVQLDSQLRLLGTISLVAQAISQIVEIDSLLQRILELSFETVGADRGAALLRAESGDLVPRVARWRGASSSSEQLAISRTIIDHVLERGEGVITTDAPADVRFSSGRSIVTEGIREAICVPIQGRQARMGVIYVDLRARAESTPGDQQHFTPEHLALMIAIGAQAGLAIENSRLLEAKVQAERLAAVGQTIATLSHHVKNILQGVRSGSFLIESGLQSANEPMIRRGWSIVDKNQTKIYNLVMDMLSYSKEREPAFETGDLNSTVGEVIELMQPRAAEMGVELIFEPQQSIPSADFDPEGIHRAVLNIVTNALDACHDRPGPSVRVETSHDAYQGLMLIKVEDNGVGIPSEEIPSIFQVFASTKGSRGTGLGLPVSSKILQEHGGGISVQSETGLGTTFVLQFPQHQTGTGQVD